MPERAFIGRPLPRVEDGRLVLGQGEYTDDVRVPGAVYGAVVRSIHAHARITALRTGDAASAPGVIAILTGRDYASDGHRGIAQGANPADNVDPSHPAFDPATARVVEIEQQVIAVDEVHHVGEAVAFVVAESAAAARDAAALVEIDYDELPVVVDFTEENVCLDASFGDERATDAAFARAALVVEHEFTNQRIFSAHMEPRAAIGLFDAERGAYTLIAGNQGVGRQRIYLAGALGVAPELVDVVCPDVGGGFGSRTNLHPEAVLVAWAARRTGRPVRWTGDRSEGFATDFQGRDIAVRAALALDQTGRMLGFRATLLGNVGAYPVSYAPLQNAMRIATTVYDVPEAFVRVRAALTNTPPTAPYRGAGRPEAVHAIERLIDIAAARMNADRLDIRQRNLIPKEAFPYRSAMGLTYDSGDFAGNMHRAARRAGWSNFEERRAESAGRGRLRGIGIANYVESPVGAPRERVSVRRNPDGSVDAIVGTQSTGQGHATVYAQVVADLLNVPFEAVRIVAGDTRVGTLGGGTHSDRSMRIVGTLLFEACRNLLEKGTPSETVDFNGRIPAFPTGCAVCELEIDPQTGTIAILQYTQVDDVGQPINPLILHGQAHGGIAQGIGQALSERLAFDPQNGTLVIGSFMDYAVPRAADVPALDVELVEDPTHGNPLRVKGGGEGGAVPAPAAIVNAVVDALREHGVEHVETPVAAPRLWEIIAKA
ncbi:MAG TPA: xanthine dehydrogenase family protein molybdopterin-binding subunit [Candidatus Acidoferrales bacterium]|nr:xanthine dehydrogenase family protein molybdopterin-binding subunit [Candidatus Acidoferrales bacterium]